MTEEDHGKSKRKPWVPPLWGDIMQKETYAVPDMSVLLHTTPDGWHTALDNGSFKELALHQFSRRWLCKASDFWAWFETHRVDSDKREEKVRPKTVARDVLTCSALARLLGVDVAAVVAMKDRRQMPAPDATTPEVGIAWRRSTIARWFAERNGPKPPKAA